MSTIGLQTPYLDDGIRSVNFFNGRVLSGEDMVEEQQARRLALLRLGRATGAGVAYGLEVTGTVGAGTAGAGDVPKVTVAPGLAVNRMGEALEILNPVDVSLLPAAGGATTSSGDAGDHAGDFGPCGPATTSYVAGEGVFLLVMSPARGREGQAVVGGLGNGGLAQSCNARSNVEGVAFKMLRLDVNDFSDAGRLRNRVAHQCYGTGTPALDAALADPFGAPAGDGYGLIDDLRDGRLADCDVPLAVIHWKDPQGIRYIDRWSARRRLTRPTSTSTSASPASLLAPLAGDRRAAEGEAMLMQFQEELDDIGLAGLASVAAADRFRYLPPVGILPVGDVGASSGALLGTFFRGMAQRSRSLAINGARARHILGLGLAFPPIDPQARELVWTYVVRENRQTLSLANPMQPYVLFASGQIPYLGEARADVARADFSSLLLP